tara:strand:+ start:166557 stop:167696 length:1140 start_codon:yes stop_codon:yes gene_type:complete
MQHRYRQVRKVTLIGALVNVILAIIKVMFGWLGQSHALIADGIHSFSDLLTDGLVIIAAKYGSMSADEDHPYGHARIETAASLGLALFLMLVGLAIIGDAGRHLFHHNAIAKPDVYVMWFAAFSVVANELVYRYTFHVGKKIQSDLLIANALHSRSDAASSLVVLVGVAGSLMGFVYLDSVAAIIVGAMIVRMGLKIGWNNLRELIDTGLDEKDVEQIKQVISAVPGVQAIHELRTRKMAGRGLLDVHIIVGSHLSVSEGHHIGECVMQQLKTQITHLEDIVVHIDSENDEEYSSTGQLPIRQDLLPQLQSAWQNLPGADVIQNIRLHYLAGMIEVDVELLLKVLNDVDAEVLNQQYCHAVEFIPQVKIVKLLYVSPKP